MPTITINVSLTPVRTVPPTVYGQGLLARAASSAFVESGDLPGTSDTYAEMVAESGVGALRYPGAGHDVIPAWHWDNGHTYLNKASGGPFTTTRGTNVNSNCEDVTAVDYEPNCYDPCYNGHQGFRTEIITPAAFVHVLTNGGTDTSIVALLVASWRSEELWRMLAGPEGERTYYKDPEPRDADGATFPHGTVLARRESQFYENQSLVRKYYQEGGPGTLIVQIGEENWAGWVNGQKPWDTGLGTDTPEIRDAWLVSTLRLYFDNLQTFANSWSYPVKFAVQFREAMDSGNQPPTGNITYLQGTFDRLVEGLGGFIRYMTCSLHYRLENFDSWRNEDQMNFAFCTDSGQGTLNQIMQWFADRIHGLTGSNSIKLIPHANSVAPSFADWQKGLIYSQYLIELIRGSYDFSFGFPGFGGRQLFRWRGPGGNDRQYG